MEQPVLFFVILAFALIHLAPFIIAIVAYCCYQRCRRHDPPLPYGYPYYSPPLQPQ